MAKLSLTDLSPDDHELEFEGVWYKLPGEVPVPTILAAMKMSGQLSDADAARWIADQRLKAAEAAKDEDDIREAQALIADSEKLQHDAMQTMYSLVMGLIKQRQPNVDDLGFSADHVQYILGLVMSDSDDPTRMEDAARNNLSGDQVGELDADGTARPTKAAKAAGRTRSKKPSPAPSSA